MLCFILFIKRVYSVDMPKVETLKHRKVGHNAEYTNDILRRVHCAQRKERAHTQEQAQRTIDYTGLNTYVAMQLLFGEN